MLSDMQNSAADLQLRGGACDGRAGSSCCCFTKARDGGITAGQRELGIT